MIYEISLELKAELAAKGVPFPVAYGPEPKTSTSLSRSRIVVQRDRDGGDAIGIVRSQHRNPKVRAPRAVGVVIRVFAQSTAPGASVHEHERLADQVVDHVTVALEEIAKARRTFLHWGAAKFLDETALGMRGLETWPGVVYELRLRIDRGVQDTNWIGEAAPEAELLGIASTTRINGGDETACGA